MKKMIFLSTILLLGQNYIYSAAGFNEYAVPYDLSGEMAAVDALIARGIKQNEKKETSRSFGKRRSHREGYGERFLHHSFQVVSTGQLTAEQLVQAQQAYVEAYAEEHGEPEEFTSAFIEKIQFYQTRPDRNFSFAVLMDGVAVGIIFASLKRKNSSPVDPSMVPGAIAGEIDGIAVDPRFSRMGIGKMLVDALVQTHSFILYWYVYTYSQSFDFYVGCGFEHFLDAKEGLDANIYLRKCMFETENVDVEGIMAMAARGMIS